MILGFYAAAQDQSTSGFKEYYPISVRPELSAGLGNNPYEQILLEAKPTVYYGIYNDLRSALNKDTITSGDAIYLTFQPEFRIYTLISIGLEAGFNSKTSFYTAFKKNTGMTPKQYQNTLIKS